MATRGARIYIQHNIWKEQQPDGSEKYFAIHPQTNAVVEIDPDQLYFWTDQWQAGEREVDDHLAAGEYEEFDDIDDFIASL